MLFAIMYGIGIGMEEDAWELKLHHKQNVWVRTTHCQLVQRHMFCTESMVFARRDASSPPEWLSDARPVPVCVATVARY